MVIEFLLVFFFGMLVGALGEKFFGDMFVKRKGWGGGFMDKMYLVYCPYTNSKPMRLFRIQKDAERLIEYLKGIEVNEIVEIKELEIEEGV